MARATRAGTNGNLEKDELICRNGVLLHMHMWSIADEVCDFKLRLLRPLRSARTKPAAKNQTLRSYKTLRTCNCVAQVM